MKRSTKFLIKQGSWIAMWIAFSGFWVVKATIPAVAYGHAMFILFWIYLFCLSKHSALVIWKLMKEVEQMQERHGILA